MAKNKNNLPVGTLKISGTIAGKPYPERVLRQRVIHDHWSVMGKERWEGVSKREKTEISRKGAMNRAAAAREAKAEKVKAVKRPKSKPVTPAKPAVAKKPVRKATTPIDRMVDEATGYDQSPDYERDGVERDEGYSEEAQPQE